MERELDESAKRRALETPGETNARLRREMEPIFKEVADLDQIKYEMEEYKQEKAATRTFRWYTALGAVSIGKGVHDRNKIWSYVDPGP